MRDFKPGDTIAHPIVGRAIVLSINDHGNLRTSRVDRLAINRALKPEDCTLVRRPNPHRSGQALARFIYRNGAFWFRAAWVDCSPAGSPFLQRSLFGPFATLDAAWRARFDT